MNCENIKEKLSLHIDNLLDPDEADKIKEHIDGCDCCRAYYNHLLKLGEMVDDFSLSENEEYWESQKDKVIKQIEQAKSDKVIKIQTIRKRGRFYKYLAVAASLVLVAFVSIYESQEFGQIKGLFDDGEMETTAISKPSLDQTKADDISEGPGPAEEISVKADIPSEAVNRAKKDEKSKSLEGLSDRLEIKPVSVPKKRTGKLQAVTEMKEKTVIFDDTEAEPIMPKPASLESTFELGKADDVSFDGEFQTAIKPSSVSSQSAEVEPLSFKARKAEVKEDKMVSHEEIQKNAVENPRKRGLESEKASTSFESDEGKDYFPELRPAEDSTIAEINIYKIRLDSLEEKYKGIYSPHYRESSAKSRVGTHPDSLDMMILELAETCFQVGILSLDEKEREDMIEKLRRLSFNGSPEVIEKIQRYIVLLLSAE